MVVSSLLRPSRRPHPTATPPRSDRALDEFRRVGRRGEAAGLKAGRAAAKVANRRLSSS